MKIKSLMLVAAAGALLFGAIGCEPSDPGMLIPNQAPDTRIVVAPMENAVHDHYISPEVMFRVQWFGHDEDGVVVGYWIDVDGARVWTVKGDSAIAFRSSEHDPSNPGKTIPMQHTIHVTAVDNAGASDPTPAARTFMAVNSIPTITSFDSNFPDGGTVGRGIAFEVGYNDSNPSGAFLKLWIDGAAASEWDSRSSFQFCNTSDPSIASSIDSGTVVPLDISLLPAGAHTLTVRVMDWGGAISDSISRSINVVDATRPVMTSLTLTYNGLDFYPDGTVFYSSRAPTVATAIGSASAYYGAVHSYRCRLSDAAGSGE